MNKKNNSSSLPSSQLFLFGMGGLIPIALFNIAGQLMGLMGNISLGLSAFWLGTILVIPRLWDAVSDPIVGYLTDNTRTRWGRRRPFLLVGGIAVALSFVMLWWIPKGATVQAWFPSEGAYKWFQLGYILVSLLIFFTACTVFEIPHGALGMEVTADPHERTRLFSAKSFFGNLFAMATPWLFAMAGWEIFRGPNGNEMDGMRYVSLLIAALLIPASFWWFFQLREPPLAETPATDTAKKAGFWADMKRTMGNRNFILLVIVVFTLAMGFNFVSLLSYYISIFYLYGGDKVAAGPLLGINGTIWAVTGLLAVFPLNWLSPRFGKRNTLVLSIALMCLAQLSKIFCYNPAHPYLVVLPTVLLSAGMLFFFTLGSSMIGDICDEDDLRTGNRSEGCYYSVYWWFIKIGTAFASFVMGLLIVFSHFDETQVTRVDELRSRIGEVQTLTQRSSTQALHPEIERAQSSALALQLHLQQKAQNGEAQTSHYENLTGALASIQDQLKAISERLKMNPALPADDPSFGKMREALSRLTEQSPESLFRMRVIEISLPILLSLVSFFYALKYSLTEEQSRQIQAALKERNGA